MMTAQRVIFAIRFTSGGIVQSFSAALPAQREAGTAMKSVPANTTNPTINFGMKSSAC